MNNRRKKIFDILVMTPREHHNKTGIGKVSDILIDKICSSKKINAIQTSFDTKIDFLIFRKLFLAFNYIFMSFLNRKIKLSKIIFCSTSRLPYFLPKEVFKVIFVHDLVYLTEPKTMSKLGLYASKLLAPSSIKRANLIICPSYSTRNDIKRFYPEHSHKCRVVHLASSLYDCDEKATDNFLPKKYILCVGTIEPRKNYKRIIFAYNSLPKEIKRDYALVIVGGRGWGNINLQKIISDLGLSERIFLKTYITDNCLKFIIKRAYVLLFPSLYEGFGLPILEAHAEGIPVITSAISSMPEVAGEGALYVDPYSTDSISNALVKIIKDKKLRDSLSSKSIINSKKFNWDFTVEKLIKNISD